MNGPVPARVAGTDKLRLLELIAAERGNVVAIDLDSERLKIAEELGAITVNPTENDPEDVVRDLTEWRGADALARGQLAQPLLQRLGRVGRRIRRGEQCPQSLVSPIFAAGGGGFRDLLLVF